MEREVEATAAEHRGSEVTEGNRGSYKERSGGGYARSNKEKKRKRKTTIISIRTIIN